MTERDAGASCPLPASRYAEVILGHGSGGRLSHELLESVFLPAYGAMGPAGLEDAAILTIGNERIAMTTDSFVVHPRTFPGGDIGALAIYGTVNDLAVSGARPEWITAAFILEEGLPIEALRDIVTSMGRACERAGVRLVAGDTKVVDRGKGDGVFITTTGIGRVPEGRDLSVTRGRADDAILVSGTMGDHGTAIMSVRAGLEFEGPMETDAAPLTGLVEALLEAVPETRLLRDPTRGGLASVLHEIAAASGVGVFLEEAAVPVDEAVRGACEILGLDPLYVANEGKLVAVVPAPLAETARRALASHPLGVRAAVIGRLTEKRTVILETALGTRRAIPLLSGEALPRIC